MRRVFISLIFGLCLGATGAQAYVEQLPIKVLSLTSDPERSRYVFRFRAFTTDYGSRINLPRKEREFVVHVHLDPGSPSAVETRHGLEILRKRFQKAPGMVIGRMSGKGWQTISGRKGEYKSIGVKVHHPKGSTSDEETIVYFIH